MIRSAKGTHKHLALTYACCDRCRLHRRGLMPSVWLDHVRCMLSPVIDENEVIVAGTRIDPMNMTFDQSETATTGPTSTARNILVYRHWELFRNGLIDHARFCEHTKQYRRCLATGHMVVNASLKIRSGAVNWMIV